MRTNRNRLFHSLFVGICLALAAPAEAATTYALGTATLVEGPAAGSNSVLLAVSSSDGAWTATANNSWLHVATTSGTGSSNVVFGFDANTGATRSGTLTIGGQTLTVTQAGSSYVAANPLVTLVSSGLSSPSGVAVDAAGNVYIADAGNNALKKWTLTNNTVSTLVASGLAAPAGVAVDAAGNVYIADTGNNVIKKWDASTLTTLVPSGLSGPLSLAVDAAGNVFIADALNNLIKRWNVADSTVDSLFAASDPSGVAIDISGDAYAASTGDWRLLKRYGADGSTSTVASGLGAPYGLAVDGSGSLSFSETNSSRLHLWCAVSNQVFSLATSGLTAPRGVAVDGARNVYIADAGANAILERPRAFVNPTAMRVEWDAGSGTLPAVLPTTQNLAGTFTPTSDQWWLTITTVTNGVVSFSLATNTLSLTRTAHITLLGQTVAITQESARSLNATVLEEGPTGGMDQVSLQTGSPTYAWTATANASWLHVLTPSGTGSAAVSFAFEENTGPERNCIVTIAGLTLKVLQRTTNWNGTPVSTLAATGVGGSGATLHGAVNPNVAGTGAFFEYSTNGGWLVSPIPGLRFDYCSSREDIAMDNIGNVYVCKPDCNELDRAAVTLTNGPPYYTNYTIMSHPYYWHGPSSMFFDENNDGYIAADWCIYRFDHVTETFSLWAGDCAVTQQSVDGVGTAARFRSILGMVRDAAGDLYIGCMYGLRKIVWTRVEAQTITDQGSSADAPRDGPCKSPDPNQVAIINGATGMALDDFGNLYFTERGMNNQFYIQKIDLNGPCRIQTVAGAGTGGCLDGAGSEARFMWPCNLVTDKGGNVYVAEQCALRKMTPDGIVTTLALRDAATGAAMPRRMRMGLTRHKAGYLMALNPDSGYIEHIAYGLAVPVATTAAQNGLPQTGTTVNFDQTIAGLLPGTTYFYRAVVTNSLGTNYGEILSFTTPMPVLVTTNFVEGPAAGTDSVVLGTDPAMAWTTTANAAWLHVTTPSGTGSANVHFTFDANSGAPRTGTVTVAYQTVTVIQAGSAYSRADFVGALVAAGLSSPSGVAVDGAGNVYVADTAHNAIKKWNVSDGSVSTLLATGLNAPRGVAVDAVGNVYIADTGNNAVKKWNVAGGLVTTLRFPDGLIGPQGVAVDAHGNVYVADTGHGSIQEWIPGDGQVIPRVTSGLSAPAGVAVDAGGSVYIADTGHGMIKQWNVLNSNVTALVSSGLSAPAGVAVDGAGNVLIADTGNGAIKQWSVLDSSVTSLISSGLSAPAGVAVDGWGNVYIADTGNQAVKETPRAFVDTTARTTSPLAHSNTVMVVVPTVQNLAGPFFPTSDQSWLTVDGANNGLVSYSYVDNYGSARTGNINVLGRSIAVHQAGFDDQVTANLVEGPAASTNTVTLAVGLSSAWTATANVDWLHVPVSAGTGGTNVPFTCDANSGRTRTGTLTIAGQTVTVTQAGSTYTPASLTNLVTTGLSNLVGVAVDGAGNVYIADTGNHAIKRLNMTDNTVSTLVSTGLSSPSGVAVDGAGNVFIADTGNRAIKRWNVTDNTVSTLVSTGLSSPKGLAVDRWGNVYIGDPGNGTVKRWSIDNGAVKVLLAGLMNPYSVAVDASGNVYFLDAFPTPSYRAIKKWTRATGAVTVLAYSGGSDGWDVRAVAVDGSGDVYSLQLRREFVYDGSYYVTNSLLWKWNPAAVYPVNPPLYLGSKLITNGLNNSWGLAADAGGNLYIADTGSGTVKELPRAFVDATPRVAPPSAWVGKLPAVVPATQILSGPLAPTSDQPWLTITDVSGGVVTYSVTACPVAARTGHIFLLGRSIAITQTAASLGATNLTESPAAGTDSVVVGAAAGATWTATANASWLHVPAGNRVGNANVVFTFDANTGTTRTGTLTLNGQTLTVIQAGATYSAANPLTTLASTGLSAPAGVAVDAAGNVYIADSANNAVLKWKAADATLSTLVSSGLNHPAAVAVDGYANLYIADTGNNAIKRCGTGGGEVTTLISTGLNAPSGVAVDGWGNLFIADQGNQAVKRWDGLSGTVTTVVSTGLSAPSGVAVDAAGNLYIADSGNNTVQEWVVASDTLTPLVSSGLNHPGGIAVDGSGNVWIADTDSQVIKKWSAIDSALTTVVASGLSSPGGVAVDTWGCLYIADTGHAAVKEVPRAFADFTAKTEPGNAGTDTLPAVVPAVQNLSGPLAPTSDASWLTVAGVTNGVVSFRFSQNNNTADRTGHLTLLGRAIAVTQGYSTVFGALSLAEGPAAGRDSVALAATSPSVAWTVTANASWLHAVTASGTGSSNVIFSFDANTGPVRSGTLTMSDQLVTVVQGGPSYVAANPLTTLASAGLSGPSAVAVDSSGNVYVADRTSGNTNAIKKWDLASNTLTTLVAEGSSQPWGVAVDAAGNVYLSESNSIKRWNVSDSTVTTLLSSGLTAARGLAIDRWGCLYVADISLNTIKKFNPANSSLTTVISGLSSPSRVAVDVAGNLYVTESSAVKKWHAANSNLTTLVSVTNLVTGVAVDGSGNVYLAEYNPYNRVTNLGNYYLDLSMIKKWSASDSTVSTLISSERNTVYGLAVDGLGNLYFAGTNQISTNNFLQELPRAFVDTAPKIEPATAGTDSLSAVLPEAQNLSAPFAPASDQPWLTIAGAVNGIVSFDFSLCTRGRTRTAHIGLLGQSIAIHQGASADYAVGLGTTNRVEGPAAGTDSVVLAIPSGTAWTATANDSWLHLTTDSGTGSGNVLFSFDANPGPTRTGTVTIAGQTLTVIQAASTYVAANLLTNLVSSGLNGPDGVAVDGSGNVFFADTANNQLKQWRVADGSVSTLISSGLNAPRGVAVDAVGNVLIADTGNNEVKRWTAFDGSVSSVVSGLNAPRGVAVDAYNNVFIADTGNNKIWKWNAAVGTPTEVVSSGLSAPAGVAADLAGNVYIADSGSGTVKRWDADSGAVTELCSGFNQPGGVAVDGSGNLYISDTGHGALLKWSAVDGSVTALVSSGLSAPGGVAVDEAGSVYVADTGNNSIQEMPRAFVDVAAKTEPAFAGTGTLPVVLPTTQNLSGPLAATSDQPWLTILGATNGVVHFHREAISGYGRTAHVSLLGRSIVVNQAAGALGAASLVVGPVAGCDSITLAAAPNAAWTATANADWLHVTTASGTGDTNVVFSFDANLGATRTGTLTIADQTLTVIQAAATYSPASAFIPTSATAKYPFGIDSAGNIYLGGTIGSVQMWNVTNNTVSSLFSDPSVMWELRMPRTVLVDNADIVYFTDICSSPMYFLFRKWDPASRVVSNLGTDPPSVLAATASGDLYLDGSPTNAIRRWDCLSGAISTVVTNSSSFSGLAVDIAGNVYGADQSADAIKKWNAGSSTLTTLIASVSNAPLSVAVDASGNIWMVGTNALKKWKAADHTLTTLTFPIWNGVSRAVVDRAGNVYCADNRWIINVLPRAFVDTTAKTEPAAAGSDTLPVVLPSTQNLSGPFAPTNDQPWLTITGVTNGVVSFSFAANTGAVRTAQISVLGAKVTINQAAPNRPPVASPMTVAATRGLSLKIPLSDIATHFSDPDGDAVRLMGLSTTSTNNRTLSRLNVSQNGDGSYVITNTAFIGYTNVTGTDAFGYTIADPSGATAAGTVVILASTDPLVGQSTGIIYPGGGPVTLCFAGIPSFTYQVQRTTDIADPSSWTTIWTTNAPSGGLFQFTDDFGLSSPPTSAYYRLSWNP